MRFLDGILIVTNGRARGRSTSTRSDDVPEQVERGVQNCARSAGFRRSAAVAELRRRSGPVRPHLSEHRGGDDQRLAQR